mmetsp:Transcript_31358/g.43654  ORF Transcript_31358/g.43654 Transcript_31358/m.43654 type:complete len:214 (-) Transcript_31358:490-1131(-)
MNSNSHTWECTLFLVLGFLVSVGLRGEEHCCRMGLPRTHVDLRLFLYFQSLLERRHVNHVPACIVCSHRQLVVGFVDVFGVDHLSVRHELVFGTEVEHFLCFFDSTDETSCKPLSLEDEVKGHHLERLRRNPEHAHSAIHLQKGHVFTDFVVGSNGVEYEVELVRSCLHLFRILAIDVVISSACLSSLHLLCPPGYNSDSVSHRLRDLYGHVA